MNEIFIRQAEALRRLISDYREEKLSLNTLIQRIEGIFEVLDNQAWKDAIFPIVLSMEQVNAFALHEKKHLTEADKSSVANSLLELEAHINRFETGQA